LFTILGIILCCDEDVQERVYIVKNTLIENTEGPLLMASEGEHVIQQ